MLLTRVLLVIVLGCGLAAAQSSQSSIAGTVTDAQGGVIAGAEVIATHVQTNQQFKATTSTEGTYVLPSLPVGVYDFTATAAGFKKLQRSGIMVEVTQRLRVDLGLEVGQVTESVTVKSDVVRIQTEDSTLSTVVENRQIEDLPLNGRNIFSLMTMVAGAVPRLRAVDGFADADTASIRINGGPAGGNQVYMDGAANLHNVKGMGVTPQADTVQEFRVETNSLKAEYGKTAGGVVTVVTKSGTNSLHGTAYEFFRNDIMDARNAFVVVPDDSGKLKGVLRYNQFGGTLGGPVRIPGVYDGRNRTFFYGGHEEWIYSNAAIMRATLPTASEKAGDFSNTRDSRGTLIPVYDAWSTQTNPGGSGYVRTPFPGNTIPVNRFDPVAVNILKLIPLPNVPAADPFTTTNNWLYMGASPTEQGSTNLKIDHRISDRDNGFIRLSDTRQTKNGTGYGLGVADSFSLARLDSRNRYNVALSENHIFAPNLINEFRANGLLFRLKFAAASYGGDWPQKLGLPATTPPDQFPTVAVSGLLTFGPNNTSVGEQNEQTIQFFDALTWVKGRHTVKFGVEQRFVQVNFSKTNYPSGQYSFSNALTSNPQQTSGSGYGMATFLLGAVSSAQLNIDPAFSFGTWSHSSFVQDDWKITPRLTLNLGLRYELTRPATERWNRFSNFDPFIVNSETKRMGALVYAGVTAPRDTVNWDRNNFGPRVGFAYAVNPKTVIRAGFGIIYVPTEAGDTNADNSNSLGFQALNTFTSTTSVFPVFRFSDGIPPYLTPTGSSGGPAAFRGQSVRYQDRNAPTGYLEQWNFTVQRQFPGKWVVTTSYTGNRGLKLFGLNYDLNQIDPSYYSLGTKLQDSVPNPFFGQIKTGSLSAATISRAQSLLPYPDYIQVGTFANHGSASTYHGLQVTVERRFSGGLSTLIAYTNSKLIDDSYQQIATQSTTPDDLRAGRFNRHLDRAIDQNDIAQRFVGSTIYQLPFFKKNRFAGGWQVNGIATIQSGSPLSVRGASNFTNIPYPNLLYNPTLDPSQRSVARWFDTNAFLNPAAYTVGNAPRTLPDTRGPGMINLNLSLFKSFRLWEGARLDFRAESFNTLNHTNLNDPSVTFTANAAGQNSNAAFGRITTSMDPRRCQLGLRLVF
jgi:hypothetical protein